MPQPPLEQAPNPLLTQLPPPRDPYGRPYAPEEILEVDVITREGQRVTQLRNIGLGITCNEGASSRLYAPIVDRFSGEVRLRDGQYFHVNIGDPRIRRCESCPGDITTLLFGHGVHLTHCYSCYTNYACGGPRECECQTCVRCDGIYGARMICRCCDRRTTEQPVCTACCDCHHCSCYNTTYRGRTCSGCVTSGRCNCTNRCDECGACSMIACGCCDEHEGCRNCCSHYCCNNDEDTYDRDASDATGEVPPGRSRPARRGVLFRKFPLTFHTPSKLQLRKIPSRRFASAEIEVAGAATHDNTDAAIVKWSSPVVGDGSLPSNGYEINTAPAAGDLLVDEITEICGALTKDKAFVTKACGLHVHIDARDFRYYDIRNLVALYAQIEPLVFRAISPSRRDTDYALPCGNFYKNTISKGLKFPKKLRDDTIKAVYGKSATRQLEVYSAKQRKTIKGPMAYSDMKTQHRSGNRYFALNLHSWFHRGTVEFRMHHGTTNATKILGWMQLWIDVLDTASSTPTNRIAKLTRVTRKQIDAVLDEFEFLPKAVYAEDLLALARSIVVLRRLVRPSTFHYFMTRLQHFAPHYAHLTFALSEDAAQNSDPSYY